VNVPPRQSRDAHRLEYHGSGPPQDPRPRLSILAVISLVLAVLSSPCVTAMFMKVALSQVRPSFLYEHPFAIVLGGPFATIITGFLSAVIIGREPQKVRGQQLAFWALTLGVAWLAVWCLFGGMIFRFLLGMWR